jgi:glyoxylase-like metal-dependent hydrolase (beta-lactamase superfamily II)
MSDVQPNLQWKIGDVTVTQVTEQSVAFPAAGFFPAATSEVLEGHYEWLKPWAVDDDANLKLSMQAMCVESEGRKIVVDTCVGQRPLPELFQPMSNDGSFLTALADAGFARETVDTVICTHMHFDHVGWNTMLVDGQWVPTFPNARYLLAQREYEHWMQASAEERHASSTVTFDDAVLPLFDAGVVDLVAVDHQVTSDVSLEHTPGHTPGHVSVRIRSQDEVAIITGDCAHHAVQLAEPDWYTAVDTDGAASTATRQRLVNECCDQAVLVIGTHFPPPTAGHIVSTPEGGTRFQPLA